MAEDREEAAELVRSALAGELHCSPEDIEDLADWQRVIDLVAAGMAAPVDGPALTGDEHEAMELTGRLAEALHRIIKGGGHVSWPKDWTEAAHHIHVLQRMIMGQAAARAYPGRYRLLGGRIP